MKNKPKIHLMLEVHTTIAVLHTHKLCRHYVEENIWGAHKKPHRNTTQTFISIQTNASRNGNVHVLLIFVYFSFFSLPLQVTVITTYSLTCLVTYFSHSCHHQFYCVVFRVPARKYIEWLCSRESLHFHEISDRNVSNSNERTNKKNSLYVSEDALNLLTITKTATKKHR